MIALSTSSFYSLNVPDEQEYICSQNLVDEEHNRWTEIREYLYELISNNGYINDIYQKVELDLVLTSLFFIAMLENDPTETVPNSITITPEGTILFIWKDDGIYREAEIEESAVAKWMEKTPDGKYDHKEQIIDLPEEIIDVDVSSQESTIIKPDIFYNDSQSSSLAA